jgi:hypothetical protein
MMRHRHYSIACALLLALTSRGLLKGAAPAEVVKITLHPAAEPVPAMKYRLLPTRLEQTRGNAAVHYGKVTAEENSFFNNRALRENYIAWQSMPLDQLRGGKVHLPSEGNIEDSLRRGALCMQCDWQLPIGDVPFYTLPLPEAQQSRDFGRILAARARIQMADGQYGDAVTTLQTGYALGRNAAAGETIVNGLIGSVICDLMSQQIFELVQQPDSPNLYWAIASLPTPMIDMTTAIEVESMGVELTFPELKDLKSAHRTDEEWRTFFYRFAEQVIEWTHEGEDEPKIPSEEVLDEACEEAARAAKGVLIQSGMTAEEVQAMSVHQLALIHLLQLHHELVDNGVKFFSVPYPEAIIGLDAAVARAEEANRDGRQFIPISTRKLGAVRVAKMVSVRTDRLLAVLRVLEALRIYGASHDGKLPSQLSDITDVPVPEDPVTGKPFYYQLDKDKASLQGPELREIAISYEVSMMPSK